VFAGTGSGSLDGVSESLRRYIDLSAVLRALRIDGGSGVIFLVMEILLLKVRDSSTPAATQGWRTARRFADR